VRTKIVKEHLNDPTFYETMSALLDQIIKERKDKALSYEQYLAKIAELAKQVQEGKTTDTPAHINTPGKVALYHFFDDDDEKAMTIYDTVSEYAPSGWKGDIAKENIIKSAIYKKLNDFDETNRVFDVISKQKELEK